LATHLVTMASTYNIGDLVWAKMKGFSPWPGRVVIPTKDVKRPSLKKPMQCIFFFGTENYAWIPEDAISQFEENKDKFIRANKSSTFKEAVDAIEAYKRDYPDGEPPGEGEDQEEPTEDPDTTTPKPKPAVVKNKVPSEKKSIKQVSVKRNHSSPVQHATTKKSRVVDKSWQGDDLSQNGVLANSSTPPRKTAENLLMRPTYVSRPVSPPLDVGNVSETLKQKHIKASCLKFGFLGLGIMGQGIVKNLLNSGHAVTVWNRTPAKCRDFVKAGAVKGQTPADVVSASDITFSCVSDPQAAKDMVFGNCGVLQEMGQSKSYVEMTSVDMETSQDIAEAIVMRGGRYMEVQIQGSKTQSEEGTLILLAGGDKSLFDDCHSCFQAMSISSFYLGDVGMASKMNLVMQVINGTVVAGLAEGLALADRAGLQQKDLLEILELSSLSCPAILDKAKSIIEGAFPTAMPLQHMQKDLRLSLQMGDQLEQPLPLTATANEVFKHAKRLGYGEHDVSAVYIRARF